MSQNRRIPMVGLTGNMLRNQWWWCPTFPDTNQTGFLAAITRVHHSGAVQQLPRVASEHSQSLGEPSQSQGVHAYPGFFV